MNDYLFIFIFLVSVLISAISQIILKISANEQHDSLVNEYKNKKVIFAYFLFLSSTLLTMFAYKKVNLSLGPVLEATGYIYVGILSYYVLKEKINKTQLIGFILIILGIIISVVL